MKKLFISQPMKGKTDEEILKEREKAIACGCETFVVFGKIFGIAFDCGHCVFCKRMGKRKRLPH